MTVCTQVALQFAALPIRTLFTHSAFGAQVVGQSPSHISPLSTTPLPQNGAQSLSLLALALAPRGQH
jgi:hypothetical protein